MATKKIRMTIWIDEKAHSKFKKFCKENGLVMGKRIEDLMDADLEKRLIKIPEIKL